MSEIDLLRRQTAQSGSFPLRYLQRDYIFRSSVVPSIRGEAMVLHILDQAALQRGLGFRDMVPTMQAGLEALCDTATAGGLFLFAGQPGNGLTTTAYTLLNAWNNDERCVHTLEEILEYPLEGLVQEEITPHYRLDRNAWLKQALESRPHALFLGDIRDVETAALAVKSALSGTLTLATIPATDAVEALRCLMDFGVSREDEARCLIGVLAQRLLPRLCPNCREPYTLSARELEDFGYWRSSDPAVTLYRSAGCEECGKRGVKGRVGVFELLWKDGEIDTLLRQGASRDKLHAAARAGGLIPLRQDAFQKALSGDVSLEVVRRSAAKQLEWLA